MSVCRSVGLILVGLSVCHIFPERAGSYTSLLLTEHLLTQVVLFQKILGKAWLLAEEKENYKVSTNTRVYCYMPRIYITDLIPSLVLLWVRRSHLCYGPHLLTVVQRLKIIQPLISYVRKKW